MHSQPIIADKHTSTCMVILDASQLLPNSIIMTTIPSLVQQWQDVAIHNGVVNHALYNIMGNFPKFVGLVLSAAATATS